MITVTRTRQWSLQGLLASLLWSLLPVLGVLLLACASETLFVAAVTLFMAAVTVFVAAVALFMLAVTMFEAAVSWAFGTHASAPRCTAFCSVRWL